MSIAHSIYLGEKLVQIEDSPFDGYSPQDWAMYYIEHYSQIDGAHHKQWVIDQAARILKGTPVQVYLAEWSDGNTEWRVSTGEASEAYNTWVESMKDGGEYDYDVGIAP